MIMFSTTMLITTWVSVIRLKVTVDVKSSHQSQFRLG